MAHEDLSLITAGIAELRASIAAQKRALSDFEQALESLLKDRSNTPSSELPDPTEHRRHQRPGRVPVLDTDPDLRAFVAARIELMTLEEIACEVAAVFPPDRQIGKSAIHAWWQRQKKSGNMV